MRPVTPTTALRSRPSPTADIARVVIAPPTALATPAEAIPFPATLSPAPQAHAPTSTSDPTHLPAPALAPDGRTLAVVTLQDGIAGRLRDAPNGNVIGGLPANTQVEVLPGREPTGDIMWVQVRNPATGEIGWFAENLLRYTTPAPPVETPQATVYTASCALYDQVPQDLLTYVDQETALPREFAPADLATVPLDDQNVAFRPILLRRAVHQPLLDMLAAMNQAGLSVWVMSGYRSHGEQQLAYDKWQRLYPDRPDISALPGHSEHQLGTAVDFSTPYMVELYGDFFNIRFARTPEGEWLNRHAAYYGFTLSYPSWGVERTGYAWEPWHFRYVGILTHELLALNITLTEYLRHCAPL